MKKQGCKLAESAFCAVQVREMRQPYENLQKELTGLPWILQGTVVETPPKSSTARSTYTWTRKVRAKTVTVALSPEQAIAFRRAIEANRHVENSLKELRKLSQAILLNSLPRARKRSTPRPRTQSTKSS